jgi:Xaa-Pro aminopeptidase
LKSDGQDAVVVTAPDSIAWLFNIRGSDVAHNPVVLATAVVPAGGKAELFIDGAKVGPEAKAHLAPLARISEPTALEGRLLALKEAANTVRLSPGAPVWFSPS